MIQVKRIYNPISQDDGYRILVDRLWPRGISKEKAHLDEWLKEIAPSNELRIWFHQDPTHRQEEFCLRYQTELTHSPEKQTLLEKITLLSKEQTVTLLYASKDTEHNHALFLLNYLQKS
ncbi:DUF488 domain-containing protein [Neisseria sp. Ec49-e6-T10]|uniref:DUF488 domain-containing protein n=1 Tax=Neisseria sp. Ec49-e6-T10 TaxID=3140744 RepID=UPI003EC1207E